MDNLKLVSGYKNNNEYRHSFNTLAKETFGVDFEAWHLSGFWDETYICYSYFKDNSIVSNVSVSLLDLIINNKNYKAVLIGTVMTRPDYRNRGLSKKLMNIVLEKHGKDCDLFYLFANKSALGFYPKFGFEPAGENLFSVNSGIQNSSKYEIRKLNISNYDDLDLLRDFAAGRMPVSRTFGVLNGKGILLWYCLNVFKDDIYYIPEEDIILIYKIEGNILNIYDMISKKEFQISKIIDRIPAEAVKEVFFYFTPDDKELNCTIKEFEANDLLFIKSKSKLIPGVFKYPVTAQA